MRARRFETYLEMQIMTVDRIGSTTGPTRPATTLPSLALQVEQAIAAADEACKELTSRALAMQASGTDSDATDVMWDEYTRLLARCVAATTCNREGALLGALEALGVEPAQDAERRMSEMRYWADVDACDDAGWFEHFVWLPWDIFAEWVTTHEEWNTNFVPRSRSKANPGTQQNATPAIPKRQTPARGRPDSRAVLTVDIVSIITALYAEPRVKDAATGDPTEWAMISPQLLGLRTGKRVDTLRRIFSPDADGNIGVIGKWANVERFATVNPRFKGDTGERWVMRLRPHNTGRFLRVPFWWLWKRTKNPRIDGTGYDVAYTARTTARGADGVWQVTGKVKGDSRALLGALMVLENADATGMSRNPLGRSYLAVRWMVSKEYVRDALRAAERRGMITAVNRLGGGTSAPIRFVIARPTDQIREPRPTPK